METQRVRIPAVDVMDDETVMLHLELRHPDDLNMSFLPEPDRSERRLNAPQEWRTYHQAVHDLHPHHYSHVHNMTLPEADDDGV